MKCSLNLFTLTAEFPVKYFTSHSPRGRSTNQSCCYYGNGNLTHSD